MAGTMPSGKFSLPVAKGVSMESGLDGRNNTTAELLVGDLLKGVSMESGLDGRNNETRLKSSCIRISRLNGVRPRWPEQYVCEGLGVC